MRTRNVVLTDHQDEMIENLVRSGRYSDPDEVVREGLRLIERRESKDAAQLQALRAAAQVGIEALDRGEFKEFASASDLVRYLEETTEELLRDPPPR